MQSLDECIYILNLIDEGEENNIVKVFEFLLKVIDTEFINHNKSKLALTCYLMLKKINKCINIYQNEIITVIDNIKNMYNEDSIFEKSEEKLINFLLVLYNKNYPTDIKSFYDNCVKDIFDLLKDVDSVFSMKNKDEDYIFPIASIIEPMVEDIQKNNFDEPDDYQIHAFSLAVLYFFDTEFDTSSLKNKLVEVNNLQFINYLYGDPLIDTKELLNCKKNGTMIFLNKAEKRVLIRNSDKKYFDSYNEKGHVLKTEFNENGKPIGYFVEYDIDFCASINLRKCMETINGRQQILKLIFKYGYCNIFADHFIYKNNADIIMPVNLYCFNDMYLISDNAYEEKRNLKKLISNYKNTSIKGDQLNRLSFGLCVELLERKNIINELDFDSFDNNKSYQSQFIDCWLNKGDDNDFEYVLISYFKSLEYISSRDKIYEKNISDFKNQIFYPFWYDFGEKYFKKYGETSREIVTGEYDVFNKEIKICNETYNTEDETYIIDKEKILKSTLEEKIYLVYVGNQYYVENQKVLKLLKRLNIIKNKFMVIDNTHNVLDYEKIKEKMIVFSEQLNKKRSEYFFDLDTHIYFRIIHNILWIKSSGSLKDIDIYRKISYIFKHYIDLFDDIQDVINKIKINENEFCIPEYKLRGNKNIIDGYEDTIDNLTFNTKEIGLEGFYKEKTCFTFLFDEIFDTKKIKNIVESYTLLVCTKDARDYKDGQYSINISNKKVDIAKAISDHKMNLCIKSLYATKESIEKLEKSLNCKVECIKLFENKYSIIKKDINDLYGEENDDVAFTFLKSINSNNSYGLGKICSGEFDRITHLFYTSKC